MKYIEFGDSFFIPTDKICEVFKDKNDDKRLVIWLEGGHRSDIVHATKEERDNAYKQIVEMLKKV